MLQVDHMVDSTGFLAEHNDMVHTVYGLDQLLHGRVVCPDCCPSAHARLIHGRDRTDTHV